MRGIMTGMRLVTMVRVMRTVFFGLFVVAVLQGRCGGKTNHGTVHEGIEIDSNLGDEKGDEGRQVTDYVQFFFRDADEIAGKEEPKGQVGYKGEPC